MTAEFVSKLAQFPARFLERARRQRGAGEFLYLGTQGGLVLRQFFGQLRYLDNQRRAERSEHGQRSDNSKQDGGRTPKTGIAQHPDDRRQYKTQYRSDDERFKKFTADIKEADQQRCDKQSAREVVEGAIIRISRRQHDTVWHTEDLAV